MSNIAVIFAGGVGSRMNSVSRPKQFLELNGKPIIIYTIELFDNHKDIDGIVVVCVAEWIPFLKKQLKKFGIEKVVDVVEGGKNGQESIYKGLLSASKRFSPDSIVLIHDGVRPLITEQTITDNIRCVQEHGNCITCIKAYETLVVRKENENLEIPPREDCLIARAPQSFILDDIYGAHKKAQSDGLYNFIDSCTMMTHYGHKMHVVIGPIENIKITTPLDFFIFRAMVQVHENQQIFGY